MYLYILLTALVKDVIGLEKSFEKEVGKDIQQVRHTHTHT